MVPHIIQLFQHKSGALWGLDGSGQVFELTTQQTDTTIPRFLRYWKRIPIAEVAD